MMKLWRRSVELQPKKLFDCQYTYIDKVQQKAPEYAEDPDKAPETSWSGSDYGGRKSETGGILAILDMLAEDLEKEIADGRKDDAEAQEEYMKQNGALQKT